MAVSTLLSDNNSSSFLQVVLDKIWQATKHNQVPWEKMDHKFLQTTLLCLV
jgi:hypothetical protein